MYWYIYLSQIRIIKASVSYVKRNTYYMELKYYRNLYRR